MEQATLTVYRPIGPAELERIKCDGYTRWPARLPGQPIFYFVTNEEYARQIASRWNIPHSEIGYVTRFQVKKSFMARYPVHHVGGSIHTEWWIPAEDVEELNSHMVGSIEVIGEYHA